MTSTREEICHFLLVVNEVLSCRHNYWQVILQAEHRDLSH